MIYTQNTLSENTKTNKQFFGSESLTNGPPFLTVPRNKWDDSHSD